MMTDEAGSRIGLMRFMSDIWNDNFGGYRAKEEYNTLVFITIGLRYDVREGLLLTTYYIYRYLLVLHT